MERGLHSEATLKNDVMVRLGIPLIIGRDGEIYNLINVIESIHFKLTNIVKPQGYDSIFFVFTIKIRLRCAQNSNFYRQNRKYVSVVPVSGLYISSPIVKIDDLCIME